MTRSDDPGRDFGHILEEFEGRHGQKPQGRLIRQDRKEPTPVPAYQKPTEEEDFASALAAFDAEKGVRKSKPLGPGDRVEGTLVTLNLDTALVDLGAKAEGIVETDLLTDEDGVLLHRTGDRLDFEVVARAPGGSLELRPVGRGASDRHLEGGEVVDGEITAINKGGAEVKLRGGRRAFCPFSQLADHRVEDAEAMVGQKLQFLVKTAGDRDVVLSRRALLEREKAERAAIRRAELSVGAVVTGTVSAVEDYGVFVDLGDLEGLVHVSELSHRRVDDPRSELKVGQSLEVKVTSLERRPDGRDRISLSRKALERDPWLDAHRRFVEGKILEGTVRRLESFGAFVELEPGIEGLVHISELGRGRRLNHPREVLEIGQSLSVRVLNLDSTKKRIALAAAERAEVDAAEPSVRQMLEEHRGNQGGFGTLADALRKRGK
ncbi:MAG: S1 RNA-binding domain-containing protein [Acidobacteriota bacterium]